MLRIAGHLLACATAVALLLGGPTGSAFADVPVVSRTTTPEDLLPDLQIEPLSDFRVQILDGRRILRFTAAIANRGDGPLELAGTRSTTSTPDLTVVQHVYQPNGSFLPIPSKAVLSYSHDRYDWKLGQAAEYSLKVPGETTPRVTHSIDLCLTDETRLVGTSNARGYGCLDGRPDSRSVTQGIAAGWSLTNHYYIRDQWVDLTGVGLPGQYCLTAKVDPTGMLTEKSTDNNAASTMVDVASNGVTVVVAGC
jgi:hypothetical protein